MNADETSMTEAFLRIAANADERGIADHHRDYGIDDDEFHS